MMNRPTTPFALLLSSAATIVIVAASLLLLLVTTTAVTPVAAWWCSGHMLTAQIALNNVAPHVRDVAQAQFQYLSATGPFDKTTDMVTGACWPDDVKGYGLKAMNEWHFIDKPLDPTGYPYTGCPVQNSNVASLMSGLVSAAKRSKQKDWVSSFALGYVVHMFGDIHQPLHCVTYFSSDYPTGDRGGNSIHLKWNNTETNLHSFWDSICKKPGVEDPSRPLTTMGRDWLESYAKQLNDTYGPNITWEQANLHDYEKLANESYQLAKDYVYANGSNIIGSTGDVIPQWYQDRCVKVAERQIVLGGLRLANTLTYMFANRDVPNGIQRILDANAKPDFGGKETGIFFGGFAAAMVVMGAGYLLWTQFGSGSAAARRAHGSSLSQNEGSYTNIREAPSV